MADEEAPKKKSKMKWIILIFLLLILGGGGFAVWKLGLIDKFMGGDSGGEGTTEQAGEAGKAPPPPPLPAAGQIVPLKTYTTNLADPLGRRLIKIALAVQVADDRAGQDLQSQEARVSDTILMLLSSKTYADVAAPESKEILKNEILSRLNLILGGPRVTQVLITDFVIQ